MLLAKVATGRTAVGGLGSAALVKIFSLPALSNFTMRGNT
jgi:hypothetical protein